MIANLIIYYYYFKVPDGMPCKINISGNPENVSLAIQLVNEVIANGPNRLAMYPNAAPQQQMYGMPQHGMPQMGGYGGVAPPGGGGYYGGGGGIPQGMPQQGYGNPAAATGYGAGASAGGYYGAPAAVAAAPASYGGGYSGGGGGGYYGGAAQSAAPVGGAAAAGGWQQHHQQQHHGGAHGAGAAAGAGAGVHGQQHKAPAPSSSPWTEHKTDDGVSYWYNSATGVSQVHLKKIIFPFLFCRFV